MNYSLFHFNFGNMNDTNNENKKQTKTKNKQTLILYDLPTRIKAKQIIIGYKLLPTVFIHCFINFKYAH